LNISWKRFRLGRYELLALALILLAIALRLILLAYGWPQQSAEEGTFGLEAMHIAYKGQFPVFMYGQDYMGTLEAYVAAVLFHLFGVSWFVLRLSLVILFALFLLCLYFLAKLLYSPKLALFTLLLLCFGSFDMVLVEMKVLGGAVETLLFGALLLLLATHLSLSSGQELPTTKKWLRLAGFAAWGCCVGLGLWSHTLVVPFVLTSGLLLLLFCHREVLTMAPVALLIGLVIGFWPLIIYNLHAAPGHDSISVFIQLYTLGSASQSTSHFFRKELLGTFFFTLPTITGMNALYDPRPLPLLYFSSMHTSIINILAEGGWSLGYLLLLFSAFAMAGRGLWQLRKHYQGKMTAWPEKGRQMVVIYTAQLMLLLAAILTIALFAHSSNAALRPWSTRYMIGLLVATPALLWPLWNGINIYLPRFSVSARLALLTKFLRRALLVSLVCLFAAEMLHNAIIQMPMVTLDNAQGNAITHDLVQMGVTHIYSGYWQCDRFIFLTQEKLICAAVSDDMSPGWTRYQPYYDIVHADPNAAYVFPQQDTAAQQSFAQKIDGHPRSFRRLTMDGYVVYLPEQSFFARIYCSSLQQEC
jgi:hypothetical protein